MMFSEDFYLDIKKIQLAHEFILDRVHRCEYPSGRGHYGLVYVLNGKAEYRFFAGERITIKDGDALPRGNSKKHYWNHKTKRQYQAVRSDIALFIYFPVLLLYDARACGIFAAFNIFSMKIPYPAVGSLIIT